MTAIAATPQRLLSLEEAAERLNKTPTQLRYMLHARTAPPSAKIGGRRMFRESDIDAFITRAFAEAAAEQAASA